MIDFHCHLDLYPDPERVARECAERCLHVLSVTTAPSAWRGTSRLARNRTRTALGLHPQLAHERISELALFDELLPRVRYVGEVGLDGGPGLHAHWKDQLFVFDHVLAACARVGGRVMSIHSRRASKEVLERLSEHPGAGIPVLHWFSGGPRDLDRAIALGCWFSVGPAMLKSQRGRSLAARMPRDRVLTESDGPFARIGDRPVLPWEVDRAVAVLAELWGCDRRLAEAALDANLRSLVRQLRGATASRSTDSDG